MSSTPDIQLALQVSHSHGGSSRRGTDGERQHQDLRAESKRQLIFTPYSASHLTYDAVKPGRSFSSECTAACTSSAST
jgi:hypothetical protein